MRTVIQKATKKEWLNSFNQIRSRFPNCLDNPDSRTKEGTNSYTILKNGKLLTVYYA
jgi:hypothetical protein